VRDTLNRWDKLEFVQVLGRLENTVDDHFLELGAQCLGQRAAPSS
jgi:hypothetical protein